MTNRARLAVLAHDVGKYVARTARNLPERPAPEHIEMMLRDLYALRPGRRASALFSELSSGLGGLEGVRALFEEVDALEPPLRAHDPAAVRRAATLACEIERCLRALAKEAA